MVAEERVELAEHVVVRARSGEVEDELVASEDGFVAVGRQRPVRVGAVEVAVGVDHLRFDPDAELHAETGDVIDQRAEAQRVGVGGDDPIAQSRRVVAP